MHKKTIVCLNGTFLPSDEACIPVTDRGFRFGDGLFETIALIGRTLYQWPLHYARMTAGLTALRICPPNIDWQAVTRELIAKNKAQDGFLRISISRGSGSLGYAPDADIAPTWVMEYLPPVPPPTQPLTLWLSAVERPSPASLPSNYKLAHGIGSTLALLNARDHGCDDSLMLSSAQQLCETSSANIFWITENKLFTPALETGCLAGTTRAAVLRLSPIACTEIQVDRSALSTAQALFMTNTRLGVWPVSRIDPLGITYDTAHPLLTDIAARFAADRASQARV